MGGDAAAARAIERVCPPPPGHGRLGEQHHFAVRAGHWLADGADPGGHHGQGLAAVDAARCEQALRLALGTLGDEAEPADVLAAAKDYINFVITG